jgi:hypothetical protein
LLEKTHPLMVDVSITVDYSGHDITNTRLQIHLSYQIKHPCIGIKVVSSEESINLKINKKRLDID